MEQILNIYHKEISILYEDDIKTIYQVEHNSIPWYDLRAGRITSSRFSDIVQPGTGKPSLNKAKDDLSLGAYTYMDKVIYERAIGRSTGGFVNNAMQRGKDLEPQAIEQFEIMTGYRVQPNPFIISKCGMKASSPDGIVWDGDKLLGPLELKCPEDYKAIRYMRMKLEAFDKEYKPQYQGQIGIGDFKQGFVFSYHPELMPVLMPVKREDEYIKNMNGAIDNFIIKMGETIERLVNEGLLEPKEDEDIVESAKKAELA